MAKKKINPAEQRHLITSVNPRSPISEQYRTIRTSIEFKMADQGLKTFLITSAEAAAGKSTTLANLAVTFAQQGKRVLLIDADLRKPSVHQSFKIPNNAGLTNVLAQQVSLEAALKGTRVVENLAILSSGPIPPNPSELLGSMAMQRLLTQVQNSFDVILIDTPPLAAVTDAQVLSRFVDGVVVVARAYQTKKDELARVKKLLDQVQANILGVVLHGIDSKDATYYYYYGAE